MNEQKRLVLIIAALALAGIITGLFLGHRLSLLAFLALIIAAWLFFLSLFQGYVAFGSKWKGVIARAPIIFPLGVGTGLFLCGSLLPAPAAPAAVHVTPPENEVWMINRDWVPKTITVPIGTTITWYNKDAEFTTVTSNDGLFDESITDVFPFSFTFNQPGTYTYYCKPHPDYEPHSEAVATIVVEQP